MTKLAPTPKASTGLLPDDAQWAAMARRDAGANAGFFYAIVSTGIYCHPGLPGAAAAAGECALSRKLR